MAELYDQGVLWVSDKRANPARDSAGRSMQVLRTGRERGTNCWRKEEVVMCSRRQRNEEFRRTDLKYL